MRRVWENYRVGLLAAVMVISATVVGYFTGLQAPMSRGQLYDSYSNHSVEPPEADSLDATAAIVPATSYRELADVLRARSSVKPRTLEELLPPPRIPQPDSPQTDLPPITMSDKTFALSMRAINRAFNGAPPTIPHPIDQLSDQTCLACHGTGFQMSSLRVSKMSHQMLQNCTQCHVEQQPRHLPATEFRASTFVGLPAPLEGPRAYPGAPPQIPHTTWMRIDCTSCHGPSSWRGLQTTHPCRENCLQCHTPAAAMEQVKIDPQPRFLEPPNIVGDQ